MEFMNNFVCQKFKQMHEFLIQISVFPEETTDNRLVSDEQIDAEIDLGKELSLLHLYLQESWNPQVFIFITLFLQINFRFKKRIKMKE